MTLLVFALGTLLLAVAKWRGSYMHREKQMQSLQRDAVEMVGRLAGMSQHLLRQKQRRGVELEMGYASLHPDLDLGVVVGPDDRVLQATKLALRDQPLEAPELVGFNKVVRRARTDNDLIVDWNDGADVLWVASPFYPGFKADELGVVALRFAADRASALADQESRRELLVQAGVLAACCLLLWAAMDALLSGRLRAVLRMAQDFGDGGVVTEPLRGSDELALISRSFHDAIQKARAVESQLIEATEAERQRIGRDIHDDVCQCITGAQLRAGVLHSALNREQHQYAEVAASIADQLGGAADVARRLSRGMTPVIEGYAEFVELIHSLSFDLQRTFGTEVSVQAGSIPDVFDSTQWRHFYRVIQELTTNAAKHGGATNIEIRLSSENRIALVEIESNGLPFDGKPKGTRGIGFQFALQRIRALGGRVLFQPRADGTLARCEIPFGTTTERNTSSL